MTASFDDIAPPKRRILPTKPPGSISATTRYAKELFLYGQGDGKRVIGIDKLSVLSGAGISTIEKWLPAWEKEAKELARCEGKTGFSVELTTEMVDLQRRQVSLIQQELEKLAVLIPTLTPGSDLHASTLKLHSATLKIWEESSGFRDYVSVQMTRAKEMAKLDAKRGANSDDGPRPVEDSAFVLPPA